jgi:hypothetical protein
MASSYFFTTDVEMKQVRIETQLGEVLKLLGRNRSAYNHLRAAHDLLEQVSEDKRRSNLLQVLSTEK